MASSQVVNISSSPLDFSPAISPTAIRTRSGRLVDLAAPDPEQIDIRDVAWALARINRFTGHASRAYTVAEHSVHVSHVVPKAWALEGLMHDAHEAYVGDVSTPLKRLVPGYHKVEAQWELAVAEKFGLRHLASVDGRQEIKIADRDMLDGEMSALMKGHPGTTAQGGRVRAGLTKEPEVAFIFRFAELIVERQCGAAALTGRETQ